jgi:UMF1 family MFS transporter
VATARQKIWGWYFFDWASQPYSTLIVTFVFAPYIKELLDDGTRAQAAWGFGVGAAGILIAILAPILGALADTGGRRRPWIWLFSACYIAGSAGLWFADPAAFSMFTVLCFFALGLIGLEFTTIFTNALLPELGTREEIGRISGSGWAFGYVGGLVALVIMLCFFAENAATGRTLLGLSPAFGLDAEAREGTRFVGPLTAIWYAIFILPFLLLVPDTQRAVTGSLKTGLSDLKRTIKSLPGRPSLFAYLGGSMFYRDALNGIYAFGGIYAAGVLNWSVIDTGIFGILAIISGALFAWLGGFADARLGPKPVIVSMVLVLLLVSIAVAFTTREAVLGFAVTEGSWVPDITFYVLGALIGAAGGVLGASSRTMMVHQADPARMTEAFGLYALAGKGTSFLAPLLIGTITALSGSQSIGVTPIIFLFLIGLILLAWVKPEGDRAG